MMVKLECGINFTPSSATRHKDWIHHIEGITLIEINTLGYIF